MNDLLFGAIILVVWIVLQVFVFPRIGVGT
jgi:hypothetical protein